MKEFYGFKISDYGMENNRVDYDTLCKACRAIPCNELMEIRYDLPGDFEQISGLVDNSSKISELNDMIEELGEKLQNKQDDLDDMYDEETGKYIVPSEEYTKAAGEIEELEDKIRNIESELNDLEYEQDNPKEIATWYHVTKNGAEILQEINENVFYNEHLDFYVWGVTHWGTAYTHVLTDMKIDPDKD